MQRLFPRRTMRHRLWFSIGLPLFSFVFYWADIGRGNLGGGGNPYSGTATDLIFGALVTVILIAVLYLYFPVSEKIERFSPAWSFGITCGTGFFFIGLMMQNIGGCAWGAYAWFFFCGSPLILQGCLKIVSVSRAMSGLFSSVQDQSRKNPTKLIFDKDQYIALVVFPCMTERLAYEAIMDALESW